MKLTADQIIERLNSMAKADPKALMDLISNSGYSNDSLTERHLGTYKVLMLGVLNGLLIKCASGLCYLSAIIDNDDNIISFMKLPSYKD